MPFTIIHDLDQLSDTQKKTYAAEAAVYFGLDPALNPFDFIWMLQESGYRKLCLYARRGTTDILRDKYKISIQTLSQHDGPGYVSFTAVGKNHENRHEIAVGSHSTEGLRGEALAAAVMTAQTRALRRLTLQFVGVGILDVSEVNAPVENEQKPVTPISLVAAPIVPISHEAGKDVTPVPAVVEFHAPVVPATLPAHSGSTLVVTPAPEESPVDIAQKEAIDKLVKTAEINRQATLDKINAETAPAEPVKKTRKPRKPKVDLGPSEPVPVAAQSVAVKPEPTTAVVAPVQVAVAATPTEIVTPLPAASTKPRLTPEQVKPFRQRHFKLVSDLEKPTSDGGGGFEPREGMGNSDKMRAFATMMFTDVTNMNELTAEQWEKFLSILEAKFKTEGPVATVKYIEDAIGI